MSVWTWNQFLLALVLVEDPIAADDGRRARRIPGPLRDRHPAPVRGNDPDPAPTLIVFILFQRQIIVGAAPGVREGMSDARSRSLAYRMPPARVPTAGGSTASSRRATAASRMCSSPTASPRTTSARRAPPTSRDAGSWTSGEVSPTCGPAGSGTPIRRPWSSRARRACSPICAYLLVQQGRLELDQPIATWWPAFAASGKSAITVRKP